MRLFLLPISTRRTLLYCQRLDATAAAAAAAPTAEKPGWVDKTSARAARLWADWERRESGWQRQVADYGNKALQRIPYEEWGLRSVPPRPKQKRRSNELNDGDGDGSKKMMSGDAADGGEREVPLEFPAGVIPPARALAVLETLGSERRALHRSRLVWSFVGMPIALPVGILPIIPNLPLYYLFYRAWCHWRALSGSSHIQHLLQHQLVVPRPSVTLDELYATKVKGRKSDIAAAGMPEREKKLEGVAAGSSDSRDDHEGPERLLIDKEGAKLVADALNVPELQAELERAVWQVEKALLAGRALEEEKRDLGAAAPAASASKPVSELSESSQELKRRKTEGQVK